MTRRCPTASVDRLWLVDFGESYPGDSAAHRPALILGPPDTFGPGFPFVILVPRTTVRRGLSLHVEVEANADTALDTPSYMQCELIRSTDRRRLVHRLGAIGPDIGHQFSGVIKTRLVTPFPSCITCDTLWGCPKCQFGNSVTTAATWSTEPPKASGSLSPAPGSRSLSCDHLAGNQRRST